MPNREPQNLDSTPVRKEKFVPLHTTDLVEFLCRHPALRDDEVSQFRTLATFIQALLHHVYRQRHEQITYLYAPLDPDRDTQLLSVPIRSERDRRCEELYTKLQDGLERANYQRLTRIDIEQAMHAATQWGVRMQVDFDALEHLDVYARGQSVGTKRVRHWRRWFRLTDFEIPLFQRVVVIFRVSDRKRRRDQRFDHHRLYLRMFKNIPQQDVDMVMPETRLRMSWWDHSRIVLPSLYAAFATLGRLLRYVVILTLFGIFKTVATAILVFFAVLFGLKSMFTYTVNTRRRYHLNVAQNLYFQTLDNNAGALLRILEEGEQQEACEAILGYFAAAVLLRDKTDLALSEIDQACEGLIQDATGQEIDFDVEDAARDLVHLGLLRGAGHAWHAKSLGEAVKTLDSTWDQWFNS